jgi:uncharacterized protein YndB with AHSA1/START domain
MSMDKDPKTLKFTRMIQAPVAYLYYAFTKKTGWNDWFSEGAEGDALKHKQIFLMWKTGYSVGLQYSTFKENEQLTFTWYGAKDTHPTEVNVYFHERGEKTEVVVEHSGVSAGQVDRITKLWEEGLKNLQSVFEEGRDRRICDRPMFGVMIEDMVTPEMAKEKNLPVDHGMLLNETLNGMGAQAAGLIGGDLIVEIKGIKIEDYTSIEKVISPAKPGDIVEMLYYRGDEKRVAQVELTLRPLPEIPPTAQDFSEKISEIYQSANAKIDEVIEGVTEAQAEYRRKPGEWNSKEVFAHLIANERDMYSWAGTLVQGNESYGWLDHLPARLKSIQLVFPQIPDLRHELQSVQREGVGFIAELPGEFVSRKSSYVRLANSFFFAIPMHYKDHIGQIQDNLAAFQGIG